MCYEQITNYKWKHIFIRIDRFFCVCVINQTFRYNRIIGSILLQKHLTFGYTNAFFPFFYRKITALRDAYRGRFHNAV